MEDKKTDSQTAPETPDTVDVNEKTQAEEENSAEDNKKEKPGEPEARGAEDGKADSAAEKKEDEKNQADQVKTEKDSGKETESSAGDDDKKSRFNHRKKDKRDQQIDELNDKVKRQMAEFDNFRKRSEKEKSAMFDMGAKSVLEKILPAVDSFERGLSGLDESQMDDPFVQGMEKVYRQLGSALENLGVTPIEAVGKPFDPNFHNAVQHVEDDEIGENIVVEEFQKGYLYHDTVLRHSMVKVAN